MNDNKIYETEFDKELYIALIKREMFELVNLWSYDLSKPSAEKLDEYLNTIFYNVYNLVPKEYSESEKNIVIKIKKYNKHVVLDFDELKQIFEKSVKTEKSFRDKYIDFLDKKEHYAIKNKREKEYFEQQEKEKRNKQLRAEKLNELENALFKEQFEKAELLFLQQNLVDNDTFKELKFQAIQEWFKKHVSVNGEPYILDDEQMAAVIEECENVIVTARAGSGKTRVIVAKIIYLTRIKKVDFNNIIVLTFNVAAAKEINDRLHGTSIDNEKCFVKKSFAYRFHQVSKNIVEETKSIEILEDKQKYVQQIIEDIKFKDKEFEKNIYNFFRQESFKVDKKIFNSSEEYYDHLRNLRYNTLDGKKVKSVAEKIICDFLFEHGIKYEYEKEYYPKSIYKNLNLITQDESKQKEFKKFLYKYELKPIKPDFYLKDYDLIWEHWAITGDENETTISEINSSRVIGSYAEYLDKRKWKEKFWGDWRFKLTNTNDQYLTKIRDVKKLIYTEKFNGNRINFENKIKKLLCDNNIKTIKRTEQDLIDSVWKIGIKTFSKMVTSFIDRLQQKNFDDFDSFINDFEQYNKKPRIKQFLELSFKVYCEYINSLKKGSIIINQKRYNCDFNQIIKQAAEIIDKKQVSQLNGIKYVLIDEYQDFSELFYDFIKSIKKQYKASIFCVGDDWQLVNRFAGSDDVYFKNFEDFGIFSHSKRLNIRTNYRSNETIVKNANDFMYMYFKEIGSVANNIDIGKIEKLNIDGFVDRNNSLWKACYNLCKDNNNAEQKTRYLFNVVKIIEENECEDIMILHRNNTFVYNEDLVDEFGPKIKTILKKHCDFSTKQVEENIKIMTMHKSKGLQANTVIVLDVNEKVIPMQHPDNELYEIFGEDLGKNYLDQVRLFYVAITRPKSNLYLLYNENAISKFIKS